MKVFVAVGTQLAFDRLIRAVDRWAAEHPEIESFAQTAGGDHRPRHMPWEAFLAPRAFDAQCRAADVLVTHAGTGSILTALKLQKPIVIVPRRACHGEHRNDHQLATAGRLQHLPGVTVAWDCSELQRHLDRIDQLPAPSSELPAHAPALLLEALSEIIARTGPAEGWWSSLRASAARWPLRLDRQ